MTVGLVAAIVDRLIEREAVSMVFVVLNVVAHGGTVLALMSAGGPGDLLVPFAGLMLAGDGVKLTFIAQKPQFAVRDVPRTALVMLTGLYVVGYGVVLVAAGTL